MEKQILLDEKNEEKAQNIAPLIQPMGSVSETDRFNLKHKFFNTSNESTFIVDLNQQLVTYQSGVYPNLGQTLQSKSLEKFLNHCHSDDKILVEHICRSYLSYCLENVLAPADTSLNFTCRVQKGNEEVIKLLCQLKVFEVHELHITKLLIKFTNISFICTQSPVAWTLQGDAKQRLNFKKRVANKYEKLFSCREIEIIKQMQNGLSNSQIGKILFISGQTVATHRKRIFKKSKCHSAIELIAFCKERGIL